MELKTIRLEIPENGNIIVGQSHFIKTVEDLYEAIVNTVPQMKFGIAFNEASGACLTRVDGNDAELKANATLNAQAVGGGTHVLYRHARRLSDQCSFAAFARSRKSARSYCATANPVEVIVAETEQGRGILGVIDGSSPKGVESDSGRRMASRSAAQNRL